MHIPQGMQATEQQNGAHEGILVIVYPSTSNTIFREQAFLENFNALSALNRKSSFKRSLISRVAQLKALAEMPISAFPPPSFEPIYIISLLAPAPFLTTKYRRMELSSKLREGENIKYQKSSKKMVALQRQK